MGMAKAVAKLTRSRIAPHLRPAGGMRDRGSPPSAACAEAADCAEKFARENVGRVHHGHPLLVLRLRDHWTWIPYAQGNLGLQRHRAPGRGVSGCVRWRRTARRASPPSRIYGHDVQDAGHDGSIPGGRARKAAALCPRGAWLWPTMRGKSYLAMGGIAMGIAGSIVDAPSSIEKYLGMRIEQVDMCEFVRRWEEGIYDHEEFELRHEVGGRKHDPGLGQEPARTCSTPPSTSATCWKRASRWP